MFTPKWKNEALDLVKGANKYLNYKRDLLRLEQVEQIKAKREEVLLAVKRRDKQIVAEACQALQKLCDEALPSLKPLHWWEDNLEVMFVAVVIALGLRTYVVQPFRIPTGSMQPTLNGITSVMQPRSEWPSLPVRLLEFVLRGREYVYKEMTETKRVAGSANGPDLRNAQVFHFFMKSKLFFTDGSSMLLPAPATPTLSLGLLSALSKAQYNGGVLAKGTVLCEGYVDAGDMVLVDKISYHFRKPKRGEVFVFDTIGIRGIQERGGDQGAAANYIKRLCGVPGDQLSIRSPHVCIGGQVANEFGMQRVAAAKGPYAINPSGYVLADGHVEKSSSGKPLSKYLTREGDVLGLSAKGHPSLWEYAALGDNTGNSLDSRYWGPLKQRNLVGPAMLALWPFTTGHWGVIR